MNRVLTWFSYVYWVAFRANKVLGLSDDGGRAIGAPVSVVLLWTLAGVFEWLPKREAWVIFVIPGSVLIGSLLLVFSLRKRLRAQFKAFEELSPTLRSLCDAGVLVAVILPMILIVLLGSAR